MHKSFSGANSRNTICVTYEGLGPELEDQKCVMDKALVLEVKKNIQSFVRSQKVSVLM